MRPARYFFVIQLSNSRVRFLSDFFASDLMMKIKKCLQPERVPGICMCETGHLRYGRNRTPPGTGDTPIIRRANRNFKACF